MRFPRRSCIRYDARYLYVAWRAFDNEPELIEARLGRRDEFPGDWVEINFDSFNDKRTGFSFTTSVSGVRGDEFISTTATTGIRAGTPSGSAKRAKTASATPSRRASPSASCASAGRSTRSGGCR